MKQTALPCATINDLIHQDYVRFKIGNGNFVKERCYYSVKYNELQLLDLFLETSWQDAGLGSEIYQQWIDLCRANKILHKKIIVDIPNRSMTVPRGLHRHDIYLAMCCYRWFDSWRELTWCIIDGIKQYPNISFWQVFHYSLGKHCSNTNHSFCNIGNISVYEGGRLKVSSSLAAKMFVYAPNSVRNIYNTVNRGVEVFEEQINCDELILDNFEEILNPKWSKLYLLDKVTVETILACLES